MMENAGYGYGAWGGEEPWHWNQGLWMENEAWTAEGEWPWTPAGYPDGDGSWTEQGASQI